MPRSKTFTQKFLNRLDKIDRESLNKVVHDLLETQDLNNIVFSQLSEGILIVSSQGAIQWLSPQASTWFGIHAESSSKKMRVKNVEDPKLAAFLEETLRDLKGSETHDFLVLTPLERHLRFKFSKADSLDDTIVITIEDKTSEQADARIREQIARVEALTSLTAGIAHEIGNPLNAIGIHLQLVKKNIDNLKSNERKNIEKTVGVIEAEVDRLDRIIKNFLKATRKAPLRFRNDDLNQLVQDSVDLMGPEAEQSNVSISLKKDKRLKEFLFDRERIHQVCINLIKNAVEAMPDGGKLNIGISHKGKIAAVRFEDEGSGIAEEDLPYIFNAFYTNKEGGSGLGLMTVYQAVAEHGGKIDVVNDEKRGAVFTIYLPIRLPKLQIAHKEEG